MTPIRSTPIRRRPWRIALGALIAAAFTSFATAETVVWSDAFDDGGAASRWSASAGTWQIGLLGNSNGPSAPNSGLRCAGTNLGGDYPANADTRLERIAAFMVPAASDYPRLRFWHWYSTQNGYDYGYVKIKPVGSSTWSIISPQYTATTGGVWTRPSLDLSTYAGQSVQIAFCFYSDGPGTQGAGWYVDDVALITGTPVLNNPEGFEGGLGDWSTDRGTWQVGAPTSGPGAALTGTNCAATILDGNYGGNVDSRLISPVFTVPVAGQNPRLRFWQWYNTENGNDYGYVEIKATAATTWTKLSENCTATSGGVWTRTAFDLSAYAGQAVQVALHFISNGPGVQGAGWYVDDVALVTGTPVFNNPEGFEGGLGDWSTDRGTWQVGVPTSGPAAAFTGTNCAATVLGGNYTGNVDSRFVSPVFTVPAANQNPRFRFWQWYSIQSGGWDNGYVEIKTVASSTWTKLSGNYNATSSGVWTRTAFDLIGYAGQTVQIAFHFTTDGPSSNDSSGWYVDDVALVTGTPVFNNPEGFEGGLGDWSTERGTWQVGVPTSGPGAAFTGTNCAGTVLGGNYGGDVDSRLVSPVFTVPAAVQNPRFRFWQWFSTENGNDYGYVEVKPVASTTWVKLLDNYTATSGGVWTRTAFDLSAYAGQTVQIALHFISNGPGVQGAGWYVDDVALVTGTPVFNNPESFEGGLGDWSTDRGTWQVGVPTSGPGAAFSGTKCAATVLGGNYTGNVDTRLVSPVFTVPAANQNPRFRFWQWYSIQSGGYDNGYVEIKTTAATTWTKLSANYNATSGGVWTRTSFDLSGYAGQTVQIAFHFTTDGPSANDSSGWYVDDVALVTGTPVFNNPEGFEGGLGDWSTDRGTWEAGVPTSGPGAAFAGTKCAGTVLGGNYTGYVDSRLASPVFTVPAAAQGPMLRFWQWYNIQNGPDYGYVEIKPVVSSTWTKLSGNYTATSGGVWTRTAFDLSAYAGQTVQIAFHFITDGPSANDTSGWYIDNVEITSNTLVAIPSVYGHPESTPLNFTAQASGSNLMISLAPGAPAGASINPTTGAFSWTPSEQQGPGVYDITVLVNQTGNNLSPLAQSTFTIDVVETNAPPILDGIGNKTINEGSLLALTVTAADPDNTNITNPAIMTAARFDDLTFGTWTTYSVASNKNWLTEEFGERYAYIYGFGADAASDDWLISPPLNLDASTAEFLRFFSQRQYVGPDLAVLVSTNYSGTGNPNSATWTALAPILPNTDSSEDWTDSGILDLSGFGGAAVRIAFRYTTTGTTTGKARLWRVDDIEIRGTRNVPPTQTLTYSLGVGAPSGLTIDPVTGQLTWTPGEGQAPGTYPVTISVTDNGSNPANQSASETIQISVREVNQVPSLAAITDKTVNEGTLLTFTAVGSDSDVPANPLTYILDAGAPSGASIDPVTGVFTWTPTEAQGPNSYTITVIVSDSSPQAVNATSLSASRTFNVAVKEVNLVPVLAAIGNKAVNTGSLLTFTVSATDADLPANTLTYSLDPGAPSGASINSSTGVFTWTPTVAGTYPGITVRVTDSSPQAVNATSLSATQAFTVQVGGGKPVLASITDKTVNEAILLTFTATATDPDLPAQTLTFSLDTGFPTGASINSSTGVFTWTPTEAQGPGSYPITVRVTDTTSLSDTKTFTVTVNEVNVTPVLATITAKSVNESSLLTFTASATDADLPVNTLTYSLDAGFPTGASINPSTGVFTWTPTEAQGPGSYPVTVRVTDSSPQAVNATSLSDAKTFTVTVNEVNVAPVLATITAKSVNEGSLLSFTAGATDADLPANSLTYSLDAGFPTGAAINSSTGVFSWTPTEAQGPGSYPITVRVTDSSPQAVNATSLSDTKTFTVTVNEVNQAPVLAAISAKRVYEETLLTFTASATDPDLPANTLTYSLSGAPSGATINPVTGVFTWTTPSVAMDSPIATFSVVATDNGSPTLSASTPVNITVLAIDDYTAWGRAKFGGDFDNPAKKSTVWGDFADPDHDGTPNLIEFMTARNPLAYDENLGPKFRLETVGKTRQAVMTYRQTTLTNHGIMMYGTWSGDLKSWLYAGLSYQVIETHADYDLVEIRMPLNRQRQMFERLEVLRAY